MFIHESYFLITADNNCSEEIFFIFVYTQRKSEFLDMQENKYMNMTENIKTSLILVLLFFFLLNCVIASSSTFVMYI